MEHGPGLPSRPPDNRIGRRFRYDPVCRVPKRDNPSGTPRELEAVQFDVVHVKKRPKHPPPPAKAPFAILPPVQKTMNSLPAPLGQPQGQVATPAWWSIRRDVSPFDALDEKKASKSDSGSVEVDESEEQHTTHPFDQDVFYYDAQTSELRSKHGESSQVVAVSDIPEDLKFRELANGDEYNKVFDTITKRYDGVDGLTEEEATHPVRKGWVLTKQCNAIISFDSEARDAIGTTPATHGPYFGQILKPDKEGNREPWIRLEFVMNSQHPAIALVLQEEGQNDVTCYFYANSIQRDLEKDEVKFQIRGDKEAGGRHTHIEEVAELRESSDLLQVHVLPWGPVQAITYDGGTRTAQAVFTGISSARVTELAEYADGNHQNEWDAMSAREKVIALLRRSQNFNVFRFWPSGGVAPVDSLREWLDTAMWATAKYGFHWFYTVQSNRRVDARDFPWNEVTVPRWLARTVAIEFNREGELVTMRPDEWNQLLVGDKCLFPMQVADAFAHPSTISYVGESQSLTIKKATCPRDFRQKGTFKAHPKYNGIFTVAIWPGEWRMGPMYPSPRPTPGARIVLEVPTPTFERDGRTHKMRGEISEDSSRTNGEIVAIIRGPATLLERSHLYSRPAGWTKDDFRIYLRQEDDPTLANRHITTVEETGEGQERTDGLDIPALVSNSFPADTVPEHLMWKAKKNSKNSQSADSQKKKKWFHDPRDRGNRGGRGGGADDG